MDFLKDSGLPGPIKLLKAILGIILIGTIVVSVRYLFEHPLVLVLALAAVAGLVIGFIRYRKHKNRV